MVCAFTGHRPHRLPWGCREEDPRCLALKQKLAQTVEQAVQMGCGEFLCGMAQGCDTFFAEAVLARGLPLVAMLPCPEQADRWTQKDRIRYEGLLLRCSRIQVLENSYSEGCMLRRNRKMIDQAQVLITVYDGHGGGTASTVAYAKSKGVTLLPIWL